MKVIHNYNVFMFQVLLMTTPTSYSLSILISYGDCVTWLLYNFTE